MDFGALSNDDLADVVKDLVTELHKRVDDLPEDLRKAHMRRCLDFAHKGLDGLANEAKAAAAVRPDSGGDAKAPV